MTVTRINCCTSLSLSFLKNILSHLKIFHFAVLKNLDITLNIPPQDYYSEYSSEQYSDGHPMYDDDIGGGGGGGGGVPPELIGPLMEVMTG